ERVVLDGSGSFDPDGDALSHTWRLTRVPLGSRAALDDPSAVAPSFTTDREGIYEARLVVNDGRVDSAPDTVTITAAYVDVPPTAEAGADRAATVGGFYRLDGTASSDPELGSLRYTWSIVSAPASSTATLADADTATPGFVPDVPGPYIVA